MRKWTKVLHKRICDWFIQSLWIRREIAWERLMRRKQILRIYSYLNKTILSCAKTHYSFWANIFVMFSVSMTVILAVAAGSSFSFFAKKSMYAWAIHLHSAAQTQLWWLVYKIGLETKIGKNPATKIFAFYSGKNWFQENGAVENTADLQSEYLWFSFAILAHKCTRFPELIFSQLRCFRMFFPPQK